MLPRQVFAFFVMAASAAAVHGQEHEESHGSHAGHSKYAIAGFIGSTHVHGEDEFTLGIEGGMNLNETWSIGAVVERAERERDSTLVLVGVGWHPIGPEFRIQLGVGRKDPAGKEENVFRAGLAYEVELRNRWFVKPYLASDFIDNEDTEIVYGFYFGRGF